MGRSKAVIAAATVAVAVAACSSTAPPSTASHSAAVSPSASTSATASPPVSPPVPPSSASAAGCQQIDATAGNIAKAAKSSPYKIVGASAAIDYLGSDKFREALASDTRVPGIPSALADAELALGIDGGQLYSDVYSGKVSAIRADETAVRKDVDAIQRECP